MQKLASLLGSTQTLSITEGGGTPLSPLPRRFTPHQRIGED